MSNPHFDFDFDFDFEALRDLHDSVNDLLHSPATKLEIINHGSEKRAYEEVSETSLKMADSCGTAKDLLLLAKDHLQHLQFAFRRVSATTGPDNAGNQFAPHRLPRKQLKKAILKRIHSIKGVKNEYLAPATDDPNLALVVNLLNEVRVTILSIVKSLSSLICTPNLQEGRSTRMEMFKLKLTRVDSLIIWGKYDAAAIQSALKRLEAVEVVVEDLEGELEQMFRRLIRTRAALLNIITS